MISSRLAMVINTCDKYSDLWEAHFTLLEENFAERSFPAYLVTDEKTDRQFDNITVLSAGSKTELPQRIKFALDRIDSEYILITLDDYFPIYPISSEKIEGLLDEMDAYKLDYIRLFKRPNATKRIKGSSDLYEIDLFSKIDSHYQVNLYVGIWRKSFLEKTIRDSMNAWEYELSLTRTARECGAKCAMCKAPVFGVLDVVRKGKLLHKAARYFKKRDIYNGPRTVISLREEFRIDVFTAIKSCTPQWFVDFGKSILRRFGFRFYSDLG